MKRPTKINGVIYETQAEHAERVVFENWVCTAEKRQSRSRARRKTVRREVFFRADSKCEVCGFGFRPALVVHHIIPVKYGGSGTASNLVVLCPNCHALVHYYSHSYSWGKTSYPGWVRDLAVTGLKRKKALRLLLIASHEAEVLDDGKIERSPRPEPYPFIITDDLPPEEIAEIEAASGREADRYAKRCVENSWPVTNED